MTENKGPSSNKIIEVVELMITKNITNPPAWRPALDAAIGQFAKEVREQAVEEYKRKTKIQ